MVSTGWARRALGYPGFSNVKRWFGEKSDGSEPEFLRAGRLLNIDFAWKLPGKALHLGSPARKGLPGSFAGDGGWDRSEARVPLGRSDQHRPFGCGLGSQADHEPRFPRPPYDPGRSDFPSPVLTLAFPLKVFPGPQRLKRWLAYTSFRFG